MSGTAGLTGGGGAFEEHHLTPEGMVWRGCVAGWCKGLGPILICKVYGEVWLL